MHTTFATFRGYAEIRSDLRHGSVSPKTERNQIWFTRGCHEGWIPYSPLFTSDGGTYPVKKAQTFCLLWPRNVFWLVICVVGRGVCQCSGFIAGREACLCLPCSNNHHQPRSSFLLHSLRFCSFVSKGVDESHCGSSFGAVRREEETTITVLEIYKSQW